LCILTVAASAQPFTAGLKVGVPLTDAFTVKPGDNIDYAAQTHRYTVGPFVELKVPAGFSVEIDALYHSYAYSLAESPLPLQSSSASSWEFPVVAKYRFLPGPVRPYVEGGLAFSHIFDVAHAPELVNSSNLGVVVGAGVELHLAVLKISPEVRYNGWTLHTFDSPGGLLQSNRNQAAILVGISF